MAIKYRYQHFPFQGPPKYTQFGIFGLKLNHLATLVPSQFKSRPFLRVFLVPMAPTMDRSVRRDFSFHKLNGTNLFPSRQEFQQEHRTTGHKCLW
jgi:hypothetical protein